MVVVVVDCCEDLGGAVGGSVRRSWGVVVQRGRWCLVVKVAEAERGTLEVD